MKLQGPELHHSDERLKGVYQRICGLAVVTLHPHASDAVGKRGRGMLLKEALAGGTLGAAHNRERPARQVWEQALGYGFVVLDHIQLGEAGVGIDETLRVGDGYAGYDCLGGGRAPGGAGTTRRVARAPFTSHGAAGLSSRSPFNTGCRKSPSAVHAAN